MGRGGNATREKEIHATSDQCSEELPGGHAADVILHEVPLAFQHHREIDLTAGVSEIEPSLNAQPVRPLESVIESGWETPGVSALALGQRA